MLFSTRNYYTTVRTKWRKCSQTSYQLGEVQGVVHNERMVVATELRNCEITCHQCRNEDRTLTVSLHAH
jgi:hypothetical protein